MTDDRQLELPPDSQPPEETKGSVWGKLKKGLLMTHTDLLERLNAALEGRTVLDDESLEYLEETLIGADLGVGTTLELIDSLRERVRAHDAGDILRLRQMLVDEMSVLLLDAPQPVLNTVEPTITILVGVNGSGKTTSAAKLAHWSKGHGKRVLLAAADTFRAAAVEQVVLWGERLGIDVIKQESGADPGAVVFDAIQAARARNVDHVIVDTAGRLHNKQHLMAELAKIKKIVDREAADWQQRTLLVLDATTGQNAVAQAREFLRAAEVDGVLLAKIDGTAKGGVVVAIARELRLPVLFLGVGESAEDLVEFRPREFAAALLG